MNEGTNVSQSTIVIIFISKVFCFYFLEVFAEQQKLMAW